jgi:hypothetical protein
MKLYCVTPDNVDESVFYKNVNTYNKNTTVFPVVDFTAFQFHCSFYLKVLPFLTPRRIIRPDLCFLFRDANFVLIFFCIVLF